MNLLQYVYNRIGECLVGVWYRDPNGNVKELRTKINFDTVLTPREISPAIMQYYESEKNEVRKCSFVDEDPLNSCDPVDCSRKYNGQRLFYSSVERRCLPSPKSVKTNKKKTGSSFEAENSFPPRVYQPESNLYEETDPIITEEDIRKINSGRVLNQDTNPSNEFDFIVCHHGIKNPYTGHCICDEGWTSLLNHIRPTSIPVHLCTVPRFYSNDVSLSEEIFEYAEFIVPSLKIMVKNIITPKNVLIILPSMLGLGVILSLLFSRLYTYKDPKPKPCLTVIQRDTCESSGIALSISDIKNWRTDAKNTQNNDNTDLTQTSSENNCQTFNISLSRSKNPQIIQEKSIVSNSETAVVCDTITGFSVSNKSGLLCKRSPKVKLDRLSNIDEAIPDKRKKHKLCLDNIRRAQEILKLQKIQQMKVDRSNGSFRSKIFRDNIFDRNLKKNRSCVDITYRLLSDSIESMRKIKKNRKKERMASVTKSALKLTYSSLPSSGSIFTLEESESSTSMNDID